MTRPFSLFSLWAVAISTLVGMVALMSTASYLLFFERPFLEYMQDPLPVINKDVRPGEVVLLKVKRFNHDRVKRNYIVARDLVCDNIARPIVLKAEAASVEAGETTITSTLTTVPYFIPGPEDNSQVPMPAASCRIDGTAEINGLITGHTIKWRSEKFNVVALQ